MMNLFRKIIHRHVWRPLKTEYRYRSYETDRMITVKRCQCRGCGRIDWFRFDGKEIIDCYE